MRLLDRYLLRELLIPLGYCISGFLVFWISAELISDMEEFQENHLHALDILMYYLNRLPEFLGTLLPLSLLLSLLYTLTSHARHHEIIAIRAAGISLWRLSLPYVGVALLISVGQLCMNEWMLPGCASRAEQILEGGSNGDQGKNPARWKQNLNFINSKDNRRWSIQEYDLLSHTLHHVDIETRLSGQSREILIAEKGLWTNQTWVLIDVQRHLLGPDNLDSTPFNTNRMVLEGFAETPAFIRSQIKLAELESIKIRKAAKMPFSIRDILEYRRLNPDMEPREASLLTTKLHAQLADPGTCLIVVLIAIPFGARSGRRDVFVGVAGSIFICFTFFVTQQLALPLGMGGHLPGALAAWLPNLLFGLFGLYQIRKVN